jgi:hypothetical protein
MITAFVAPYRASPIPEIKLVGLLRDAGKFSSPETAGLDKLDMRYFRRSDSCTFPQSILPIIAGQHALEFRSLRHCGNHVGRDYRHPACY